MDYEWFTKTLSQPFERDNEIYCLACMYKGLTEIYDKQFEHDKFRPLYVRLSQQYAKSIYTIITGEDVILWSEIRKEIRMCCNYTSDMWISEYRRLLEEGKLDRYLDRFRIVQEKRMTKNGLKELFN